MLVLDRGAAGKIRIAAADAGAEVDGNDAAAAGHGNARHRRSPASSAASSSGARSGRDASFRGGIRAMTGSGLASAGAADSRFVATGGRHGERTSAGVGR